MREFRVRDPIHGFISLTPVEHDLIDCPAFQRLRDIRQLSFTYLAYPGAEHSRFAHSLGVTAFSSRMYDSLTRKHHGQVKSDLKWSDADIERNRQLLRLASLLHDIGHPPFSHASEELFPDGLTHEDYTRKVILDTEIAQVIKDYEPKTGITPEHVSGFFEESGKFKQEVAFLTPIFSGEVDSDKMDYLLRDSLFAGVSYGKYDHERLIGSLCLIESPLRDGNFIMALEEGGVHALEALVLARYFMFTQVYFHKVARAFHLHLVHFLREQKFKYPSDVHEFLQWTDSKMTNYLLENSSQLHANRIVSRNHYKLAYKSAEHTDKEEYKKTQELEKLVMEKFGENDIFCDYAEKASHKFNKIDFYVHRDSGRDVLITKLSGIIARLEKIDQFRVYCDKSKRDEVKEYCRGFSS